MSDLAALALLKRDLTNEERIQFDVQMSSREKNPTTALLLSLFLGGVGVDRFYVGDTGLGVLKLFTLGGFLFWWLIDLFLISGVARRKNLRTAEEIRGAIGLMRRSG